MVEVTKPMSAALNCPVCDLPAEQRFVSVQGARIDDMENVGADRRDGTAGLNLGLPGVTDSSGSYRARSGNEVASNRRAREIAKANDLTPLDGGRYRSRA